MSETHCTICYALLSDHKRRRQHSLIQCKFTTNRPAPSSNATVGSLYDGCIDKISRHSGWDVNFIIDKEMDTKPTCIVLEENQLSDGDLLEILDIYDELWLSVMLGMTSDDGFINQLYNYGMSNDRNTRFLRYRRIDRHKCLIDNTDFDVLRSIFSRTLNDPQATHIITDVNEGIEFIMIIEFSKTDDSATIDSILKKLCNYFTGETSDFLTYNEQQRMNQYKPVIMSQVAELQSLIVRKNFAETCQGIHQYLFKKKKPVPLLCKIHPIKILHSDDTLAGKSVNSIDNYITEKIRQTVLNLFNRLKTLDRWFVDNQAPSISKHLECQYTKLFEEQNQLKNIYQDIRKKLSGFVFTCRNSSIEPSSIDQQLKSLPCEKLNSGLKNLYKEVVALKNKQHFINELEAEYGISYMNVAELEDDVNDQKLLEEKVLSKYDRQLIHILCSTDQLIEEDPNQHKQLCQKLMNEKKMNQELQIVFADFSSCKSILRKMKLLPESFQLWASPVIQTTSITNEETKEINILLLGETGVGKSTFINAFANYLSFHSMQQAEQDELIVAIPVSFVIIDDTQFNEHQVKLGEQDNSKEDFDHPGQTTTRHCQSYVFSLQNRLKLRFIDTPGIADTRGVSQDDKNIQYILSYVSHFSHLNAVCILLKPTTTRIHILFRSCLEQIFNFLGPHARDNVLFCFTSGRSTFFSPGNTVPILRKMLNDLPADRISQISKENMFFFDSEAFRYLAAIKSGNNIPFSEDQRTAYEMSWNKSVEETIRFMNLIKSRKQYQMNAWHSINHAQIIIMTLIRPILETLRLNIRNQILKDTENDRHSIHFDVEPIKESSYLCTHCTFKVLHNDYFPTVYHPVHHCRSEDICDDCQCPDDEHLSILYQLTYSQSSVEDHRSDKKYKDIQNCLLDMAVLFTRFLSDIIKINKNPFLPWFDLFLREEKFLQQKNLSNDLNNQLHQQLNQLKHDYELKLEIQEQINLDKIYQSIETIQKLGLIQVQINAITKSQLKVMQNYEINVSSDHFFKDQPTNLLLSITKT